MEPEIKIFVDKQELVKAMAERLTELTTEAISENGHCSLAISGGNTPLALFDLLAADYRDKIDWEKLKIFWVDERYVAANDPENNSFNANEHLFNKLEGSSLQLFPVPVDLEPADAATAYENTIKAELGPEPVFDIILLGMGNDGHTASLFPGSELLNENTALVRETFIADKNMFRISFTLPLINAGRNIFFLVEGSGKAKMLSNVMAGYGNRNNFPAARVVPVQGGVTWMLDEDAAKDLREMR